MDTTSILFYVLGILLAVITVILYWVFGAGRNLFMSAATMFMGWQLLRVLGTLLSVDMNNSIDREYLFVVIGGLLCFTIGVMVANGFSGFSPRRDIARITSQPVIFDLNSLPFMVGVIGMGVVCLVVGIYFASAVGYNTFFTALQAVLSGQDFSASEYSQLRTSISRATDAYYAPGYTLQFTAMLLPVVLCLLYFRVRETKRLPEALLLIALAILDFYFLTIIGGRVYLFNAVALFAVLVSPWGPLPKFWPQVRVWAISGVVIFVLFYVLSTTLMGRASASAGGIFSDVLSRLVTDQSQAEVTVMRLIMPDPAYFGQEWSDTLLGVLPGHTAGYGFSTQLHAILHGGNSRGSFGLPIWGSLWYNWGTIGTLIWGFVLGFAMQHFTIWYLRGPRTMLRMIVLYGVAFHLSQVIDPYSVFLEGIFTILFYYFLLCVIDGLRPRVRQVIQRRSMQRQPLVLNSSGRRLAAAKVNPGMPSSAPMRLAGRLDEGQRRRFQDDTA